MADEPNDFFPATSTVGKSFLNLKDGPKEVGIQDVSSMGGDCRNMKMVTLDQINTGCTVCPGGTGRNSRVWSRVCIRCSI
jgi:hypothetical protein